MPPINGASALRIASKLGLLRAVLESEWRRRRLPILCYHGVSTDDEHLCFPGFFMDAGTFESRLDLLKHLRINILPLDEALAHLKAGTLPRRSAVLTIDDGFYGAYSRGWPILKRYGYPATVYLTSYYVAYNVPVFDPMADYLLWKASDRRLDWRDVFGDPIHLDAAGRSRATVLIRAYAARNGLSGQEKNVLLGELSKRLEIDYEDLCSRRMFHLINPSEVQEWAEGVDIQLHSHRHRLSREKGLFLKQLQENQAYLESMIGKKCMHFCYPGGMYLPDFPGWLREFGIESAVTSELDLAGQDTNLMLLPRVTDTATLSAAQLEGWITGARLWLPTRRGQFSPRQETQILEDEVEKLEQMASRS